MGTTSLVAAASGHELLLELDGGGPLGRRVERALRDAIRSGRLAPGARLPSSRTLARDLGVSRRLVVEAYAQLSAEGWLEARHGSGTRVAPAHAVGPVARATPPAPEPRAPAPPDYDFFPGVPDLAAFPRADWARALRETLATLPDAALHYPDPAGVPELRAALAAHLRRVRGVDAQGGDVVVTNGTRQALHLLGRVLADGGAQTVAVERPSLPQHVETLRAAGLDVAGVPVDADGLDVEALARSGAQVVVVTPAHQFPLGVAMAPERRASLIAWAAGRRGRLVIEDDYDAEHRYDRRPLTALQAQAPDLVAYAGTASKTLAPGLRLGWIAAPPALAGPLAAERALLDGGGGVVDQHAFARLLDSSAYDRHVRLSRRRLRARRDALVAALARTLPAARIEGIAAGLHALVRLPAPVDAARLAGACAARSLGVPVLPGRGGTAEALILGYANLSEPAIAEGVRRLGAALDEAA